MKNFRDKHMSGTARLKETGLFWRETNLASSSMSTIVQEMISVYISTIRDGVRDDFVYGNYAAAIPSD